MRRLIVRLFFSIVIIALILVILESSAGILNPIIKLSHSNVTLGVGGKDVLEYPSGYIKDRELFWRLSPDCKEYNSVGFRDRELALPKDSHTFRIICIGDSVTIGWPADIEDTYPKILERLLNAHFPKKRFEVFNAGVPGYSSYQGLLWLEKDILRYQPDLIIVYYGINDRAGGNICDKDQKALPYWMINTANYLRRFKFYMLLNKIILHFRYPPQGEKFYLTNRVPPQDYRNNLNRIMKIAADNGTQTLFIVHPVLYDREKKIVFTDSRYTPPEDILQFNIYSLFEKREKEADALFLDDIRPDNFHLTDKGHRILAEAVYRCLLDNKIPYGQ